MSGIPKNVQNARRGRYNRQTGLKMQGDANRVDLSGLARRAIKRRVHTNFKVCSYPTEYRCDHGVDPETASKEALESHCYKANEPGVVCIPEAPWGQSAAGGVGRKFNPRFRCGSHCVLDPDHPHIRPDKPIPSSCACYGVDNIRTVRKQVKGNDKEYDLSVYWDNPPEWDECPDFLPEGIEVQIIESDTETPVAWKFLHHTSQCRFSEVCKYNEFYYCLITVYCRQGTPFKETGPSFLWKHVPSSNIPAFCDKLTCDADGEIKLLGLYFNIEKYSSKNNYGFCIHFPHHPECTASSYQIKISDNEGSSLSELIYTGSFPEKDIYLLAKTGTTISGKSHKIIHIPQLKQNNQYKIDIFTKGNKVSNCDFVFEKTSGKINGGGGGGWRRRRRWRRRWRRRRRRRRRWRWRRQSKTKT